MTSAAVMHDTVETALREAGFPPVGDEEGFDVVPGPFMTKVFWVKADRDRRQERIGAILKVFYQAGFAVGLKVEGCVCCAEVLNLPPRYGAGPAARRS